MQAEPRPRYAPNHKLIGLICGGVVVVMVGAAYAAVPLYRAFCEATGFDGAVKRGAGPDAAALKRMVTVRFDTNVRGLPWSFKPELSSQDVRIGAPGLAFFKVRNDGDVPMTGRATYNVVPESAGAYFVKTQCFCFSAQTIPAHTEMRFPVIYYVQPGFAQDRETRQFQEITLSYTFFPVPKAG
ncbi:MAG TPA: cytochrome c oxidase assembly protein [Caulobacteraceae bacterium]|jgi:cytochrome c oxidase assembly protein subunit 11|nr:cytochrome c oxidase assembly protein [Caulobacteraceae bacterium]